MKEKVKKSSNNEKERVMDDIKKFILDSDVLIRDIPEYDVYSRDYFKDNENRLLFLVYVASLTTNPEDKKTLQVEMIARLGMLDFFLERAYVLKYITGEQLKGYNDRLDKIIKEIKNWMEDDDKSHE